MRTTLECLPCFQRQARHAAQLSTPDPAIREQILAQTDLLLPRLDTTLSPPENALRLYTLIAQLSGCADPFAALKEESNRLALQLLPPIRQRVGAAPDPLWLALQFALAGNIIDFGAQQAFDLHATLAEAERKRPVVNDYEQLRTELATAATILYLGDNCGELVFDGLLLEQMPGKQVFFAGKERAIINDALVRDARSCGLDRYATLLSNGTGTPGTPLAQCSEEFRATFRSADLIISKGQGNFETLSETVAPIYFLLTVKCPVVAAAVAAHAQLPAPPPHGATILLKNRNR